MLAHELSGNVKTLFAELQGVVYNYLISGAASVALLPFHFLTIFQTNGAATSCEW